MPNKPNNKGRDKSRPYIVALLLCAFLAGCGGKPPLALPAHYACVALPAVGGAAVVDLKLGAEKLLGYVKAANRAGISVACGGGRLYLANRDNGNLYVYDIAEALGNTGDQLPGDPLSFGLKGVVLVDASIGGMAWDERRGLLYVISHTSQEGPTFNLLTVVQGAGKRTSLALPADVSGTTIPQLSADGSRLYIPAPAANLLLTVQVGDIYKTLGSVPLNTRPPYTIDASGTVSNTAAFLNAMNLTGTAYYISDGGRAYISYRDGLAIFNQSSGKVERTIKLSGGPPGQVVIGN